MLNNTWDEPLEHSPSEHINNINIFLKDRKEHAVPKHFARCHNKDPMGTSFVAIDKYTPPWRGGSLKRGVSQMEVRWIYELKSYTPFGMNVDWNIKAFINNA